MNAPTVTCTRTLVALDIDGTLIDGENKIPSGTVQTLDLVRAAGHEIVLASGRSLAGLLPIAVRLGVTDGWAVASNGAYPWGAALDPVSTWPRRSGPGTLSPC